MNYSISQRNNEIWSTQTNLTREAAVTMYREKIGIIPVHLHKDGICINPWDSDVMQCQFKPAAKQPTPTREIRRWTQLKKIYSDRHMWTT